MIGSDKYPDDINSLFIMLMHDDSLKDKGPLRSKEYYSPLLETDHLYSPLFRIIFAWVFREQLTTEEYKKYLIDTLKYENRRYYMARSYKSTNGFIYSRLADLRDEDSPSKMRTYYSLR
jgi:hypothetical protein